MPVISSTYYFQFSAYYGIDYIDHLRSPYQPYRPLNYDSTDALEETIREMFDCILEYENVRLDIEIDFSEECRTQGHLLQGFVDNHTDFAREIIHLSSFGNVQKTEPENLLVPFCENIYEQFDIETIRNGKNV